jgi:hypothetical protein
MDDVIICTFPLVFHGFLWRTSVAKEKEIKRTGSCTFVYGIQYPQLPRMGVLIICHSFLRSLFRLVPYLERIQPKYLLVRMRAGSDGCNHKVFVGGNRKILITHSQFLPSRANLKHIQLQLLLLKYKHFRTSCVYLLCIYLFLFSTNIHTSHFLPFILSFP